MIKIIGLDPGLRHTGWGIVTMEGNALHYVASGAIHPLTDGLMADRLCDLHQKLRAIFDEFSPTHAAIENVFVNQNPVSTLKLGMARGVALMTPALYGLHVAEYASTEVKKSIVGSGHAAKEQVAHMVKILLPKSGGKSADEADALAIALTHAHNLQTSNTLSKQGVY